MQNSISVWTHQKQELGHTSAPRTARDLTEPLKGRTNLALRKQAMIVRLQTLCVSRSCRLGPSVVTHHDKTHGPSTAADARLLDAFFGSWEELRIECVYSSLCPLSLIVVDPSPETPSDS